MKYYLLVIAIFISACQGELEKDCGNSLTPLSQMSLISNSENQTDLSIKYYSSCQELIDKTMTNFKGELEFYSQSFDADSTCNTPIPVFSSPQEGIQSPTNNQVGSVDEADFVKLSKKYIFYARKNEVIVVDRKKFNQVHSFPIRSEHRPAIFVYNQRLAILEKLISLSSSSAKPNYSKLSLYEISGNNFKLVLSRSFLGEIQQTRLSEKGLLSIITHTSLTPHWDITKNNKYLKELTADLNCQEIIASPHQDGDRHLTQVHNISISKKSVRSASKTVSIEGSYPTVYQNNGLYLVKSNYSPIALDFTQASHSNHGVVARLSLDSNQNWKFKNFFATNSHNLTPWSFHEKGNFLYLASQSSWDSSLGSQLSVYKNTDSETLLVSQIDSIAPFENLHAVRFTENYAYLVTFRQVDPLFIINIKDPARLVLESKLKVPGFSSYLHPTVDGSLVGVGYGDQGRKLQLSLFDVNNPLEPKTISQIEIGDGYSQSTAQTDHRGFQYWAEQQVVTLPFYNSNNSSLKEDIQSGALVYNVNGPLTQKAQLSHQPWIKKHCDTSNHFSTHCQFSNDIQRALPIDGQLMAFSDFGITAHDPEDQYSTHKSLLFHNPQKACQSCWGWCGVTP